MDEDKKKIKRWKKKRKVEVDGGPDLRLHRAETAHVSRTHIIIKFVSHGIICFYLPIVRVSILQNF
jgi:hypothetical protein